MPQDEHECIQPCKKSRFKLSNKATFSHYQFDKTKNEDLLIKLQFWNPMKTLKKEYFAYDRGQLIADVGGLLGMLLGASLFSLFELIVEKCRSVYIHLIGGK